MSPGRFALEEGGLRCLVTLNPAEGGGVEGGLELGDLRFSLRGRQGGSGELSGVVLDASGWMVALWRATPQGERLRLELRLPETPVTHLDLARWPGPLTA